MVGMPRPLKMHVLKVTASMKHERPVLNALQNTQAVELIDVEWTQPIERAKPAEEIQKITSLIQELDELIEFLEISAPQSFSKKKRIKIKDQELGQVLNYAQDLVNNIRKLRNEWTQLESQQENLENVLKLAEIMATLPEMFFEDVGEGPLIDIIAGTMKYKDTQRLMWQLEAATNENYFFVEQYVGEGDSCVVVVTPNPLRSIINRILSAFGFNVLEIPPELKGKASEVIIQTKKELEKLREELQKLEPEKKKLAKEYQNQLLAAHEALKIEEEIMDAKTKVVETETGFSLWAWISVRDIKKVTKTIQETTNNEAKILVREPDLPEESFPTRLENNTLVKPLEELTKSYGMPGYREIDPSIFMALVFPIIFGIMFADVGHGLVLLLMGVGGVISKRRGIPTIQKGMMDELKVYLKKGGWLLILCGICSIVFGFVFGSFFGMEEFEIGHFTFKPLWFSPAWEKNSEHMLHAPGGPYRGISGTILMLELSIMIGIIHITLGLFLRLYMNLKEGKKLEAFYFPVMLFIFYFTSFFMVFTYGLDPTKWMQPTSANFTFGLLPHFQPPMPPARTMFLGGFLLPILVMMVLMTKQHGMDGISEVFDFVLSLISHTLSYARILAVNRVHGILSALFLVYLPIISTGIEAHTSLGIVHNVGILGIIIQNFIIMTLEVLISFLQTLRLNWVEFFSKFYEGRGRHLFKPFGHLRRFTTSF
ncbi:MAG: V-type ATP synthase subunit I [Candidatus Hodarchaeota archaeon]